MTQWLGASVGVVLWLLIVADGASAQPVGTFRWQLQPYCNVISVTVVQAGGIYTLDGTDDRCGTGPAASVVGVAFLNPSGLVGFGLTSVLPGGAPLHTEASITLTTLGGTWRDSAGSSGSFVFTPGAGVGGLQRPAPAAGLPPGSVTSSHIAPAAVGSTQLANDSVTTGHIVNGSLTGADLAPASVGAAQLANDSISTTHIANGSVTMADLAPGSVGGAQLIASSVTSSHVANGTLTIVDMADEPRVSVAAENTSPAFPLGSLPTVVRSLSIAAPANGRVIVNASGLFQMLSAAAEDGGSCSITTGNDLESNYQIYLRERLGHELYVVPFAGTRVYTVTPGSLTIRLVCARIAGGVTVIDPHLNALFIAQP